MVTRCHVTTHEHDRLDTVTQSWKQRLNSENTFSCVALHWLQRFLFLHNWHKPIKTTIVSRCHEHCLSRLPWHQDIITPCHMMLQHRPPDHPVHPGQRCAASCARSVRLLVRIWLDALRPVTLAVWESKVSRRKLPGQLHCWRLLYSSFENINWQLVFSRAWLYIFEVRKIQ